MSAPSLAEAQRWLRWAITHPGGPEAALGGTFPPGLPARFHLPAAGGAGLVAGEEAPGRRPLDRLAVYASGYFSRLHGALAAEYPGVLAALGPERFREVVARHLLDHPSRSPSLADLGAGLAATLAALPLAAELPWVSELAALERALAEVWLEDAAPAGGEFLPAGADPSELRFRLAPTVRLLELHFSVDRWREDPRLLEASPRRLAVARAGGRLTVSPLTAPGFALLASLAGGATLGEACDAAGALGATAQGVQADLASWATRGWLLPRS